MTRKYLGRYKCQRCCANIQWLRENRPDLLEALTKP